MTDGGKNTWLEHDLEMARGEAALWRTTAVHLLIAFLIAVAALLALIWRVNPTATIVGFGLALVILAFRMARKIRAL